MLGYTAMTRTNPGTPLALALALALTLQRDEVEATLKHYRRRLQAHPWSDFYQRMIKHYERLLKHADRRGVV